MATSSTHPIIERLIKACRNYSLSHYSVVRACVAIEVSDIWCRTHRTPAHLIAELVDAELSTVRNWLRVGRALTHLPNIESALNNGTLAFTKARSLVALATPSNEVELLKLAVDVPTRRLDAELARWSLRHQDPKVRRRRLRDQRCLRLRVEPDGMVSGFFLLEPAAGAALSASIDAQVKRCKQNASREAFHHHRPTRPSLAAQRADALIELCGGKLVPSELVLHMKSPGELYTNSGISMSLDEIEQLLPSAFVRVLINDANGRPIAISSRRRFPTRREARFVESRDRSCVDCGSSDLLEFDHVPAYYISSRTSVNELELRCAPCHRSRHREEPR